MTTLGFSKASRLSSQLAGAYRPTVHEFLFSQDAAAAEVSTVRGTSYLVWLYVLWRQMSGPRLGKC